MDTTDDTVYLAESDGSIVLTKSDDEEVNIYENGIVEIDGIFYQCRAATNVFFQSVFFQPKVNSDSSRLVWDGSIKSTREVIELLGDKVGYDSVSQDYFHDYIDNVRRVGITHTKLGSRILQVGGSLKIADFIEK